MPVIWSEPLCPCKSSRTFRDCCRPAVLRWPGGMKLMLAFVVESDGRRIPLDEYTGPKDADLNMEVELNPIYAAWIRNNVPEGADPQSPEQRGQLLEFMAAFTDRALTADLARELDSYRRSRRSAAG